ncbi:hypothetical protein SLEP1_g34361 [Rubroshorea leprosula]|uniref:Ferredoxin n=1 Tax=Rubroshorea leprosula TaxID=152421 RepID=A0AAV5KJT7_9ROSI|nr:hypothetical protein SLEP1_g34361 [Rubroshorea leprosula]
MASLASFPGVSTSVVFGHPATGVRALPNMGQSLFDLKHQRGGRLFLSRHKVVLITPEGGRQQPFDCPENVDIVTQAWKNHIELPSTCNDGTCYSCAGKLIKGRVDQRKASSLSDKQIEEGYILTCVATPLSDVEIETHKEEKLI